MDVKLQKEIRLLVKAKKDISSLIQDKQLSGMDLSYAKISQFQRRVQDLDNVNLSHAVLGDSNNKVILYKCSVNHANFINTRIENAASFKFSDFRHTNFTNCWMPRVDYRGVDFRGCLFCGTVIPVGSVKAINLKVDNTVMGSFGRSLNKQVILMNHVPDYKEVSDTLEKYFDIENIKKYYKELITNDQMTGSKSSKDR